MLFATVPFLDLADPSFCTANARRRAVARGLVVRVRRGVFIRASDAVGLDPRQRYAVTVRAVLADARHDVAAAGPSAAAVWGVPIWGDWPAAVTVLDRLHSGGRSETGVIRTAVGWKSAEIVEVHGLRVTSLARTVIDVARGCSTVDDALGTIDWALRNGVDAAVLRRALLGLAGAPGIGIARAALVLADGRSESMGESWVRAAIIRLGFTAPDLQVVFTDDRGEIRVDFLWSGVGVAGEFDGRVKYRPDDGDPAQVVWREKLREDRLRRLVRTVVRITWDEARDDRVLTRLLVQAGVPRA